MPQYFAQMTLGVLIWDYLITISDEVEYVWKREKTWSKSRSISPEWDLDDCAAFWLFVVVRIRHVVGLEWWLSAL